MGEWQPIETAPKDGSAVLLYQPKGSIRAIGYWQRSTFERWESVSVEGDTEVRRRVSEDKSGWHVNMLEPTGYPYTASLSKPTHWMPLPASPEQDPPQDMLGKDSVQP